MTNEMLIRRSARADPDCPICPECGFALTESDVIEPCICEEEIIAILTGEAA